MTNRLSAWFNSIRGRLTETVVDRPLLNELELHILQQHALSLHDKPFVMHKDVQHQLLGERTSSFSGSGYEFAEHRRYVSGDDMRFIDWRVMARTGKLYRKVFNEERRPQVYLLVDRRAPMRFGTHTQLKVSCAVRQAIRLLHQARQQQLLTGCVILEREAIWLRPSQSRLEGHNVIQQLNQPCPPRAFNEPGVTLNAVLSELAVRISPGCIIYLLSDFHDLDDSSRASLYHLAQQHQLNAIQFLDPLELELPDTNNLPLYDEQSQQLISIAPTDNTLRKAFHSTALAKQQQVQTLIEASGGRYRLIMTDGDAHG